MTGGCSEGLGAFRFFFKNPLCILRPTGIQIATKNLAKFNQPRTSETSCVKTMSSATTVGVPTGSLNSGYEPLNRDKAPKFAEQEQRRKARLVDRFMRVSHCSNHTKVLIEK